MPRLKSLMMQIALPSLFFVVFVALCLYRLNELYVFNADPARDTLESLRLLRSKDITFIGPPLSFGLHGLRETYFSSAIYYLGALGLAISGLSVVGPVIIIALMNGSAVFPLFSLLKKQTKNPQLQILGVLIYITNPIVVMYSRVFWNPSPLIGLSVWAVWALSKSPVLFGLIVALAIYFHYFAATLIVFGIIYYLREQSRKAAVQSLVACCAGLAPFLFFEIRNEFYLTQSFLYNLGQGGAGMHFGALLKSAEYFLKVPVAMLGLLPDQFSARLIQIESVAAYFGLALWAAYIYFQKKSPFAWFVAASAVVTAVASKDYIHIQYFFPAVGALWLMKPRNMSKKSQNPPAWLPFVLILLIILQNINTFYLLISDRRLPNDETFPTLQELETMTQHITASHTSDAKVNITENIYGDARALYMRFFLEREQLTGLQTELQYDDLDELFVVTPSLDKTIAEKRWEFTASGNTELVSSQKVGMWQVLKFEKPVK